MYVVVRGFVYKVVCVFVCDRCVWCWRTKTWPTRRRLQLRRQRVACRPVSGVAAAATRSGRACHHVRRPRNACIRARARSRLYRYIHKLSLGNPSLRCCRCCCRCCVHLLHYLVLLLTLVCIIIRHDSAGNLRAHHNAIYNIIYYYTVLLYFICIMWKPRRRITYTMFNRISLRLREDVVGMRILYAVGATIRVRDIIIHNIICICIPPSSCRYTLRCVPMYYYYYVHARAVASITNDFRGRRWTVENRRI